jgi:hypothetical protein
VHFIYEKQLELKWLVQWGNTLGVPGSIPGGRLFFAIRYFCMLHARAALAVVVLPAFASHAFACCMLLAAGDARADGRRAWPRGNRDQNLFPPRGRFPFAQTHSAPERPLFTIRREYT